MNTRTEDELKNELNANPVPSRGIRRFEASGHPKPFAVQWRLDGKVKTEFFAESKDRDARAVALEKARKKGDLVRVMPRSVVADWHAFQTSIGSTPWQDVVAGWQASLKAAGAFACNLTVREAVDAYLAEAAAQEAQNQISSESRRHKRQKLAAFAKAFGENRLSLVTGEDIKNWIETDLGFDNASTFNNYRKHVRGLYDHFRKQMPQNPCDDVKTRTDTTEHVGILTPQQTAALFAFALENGRRHLIGRLALEAFAGLRFASAYRLEKADINFADKGITLPKHKLKTRRRHYIDGLPENLWTWLAVTNDACWTITPNEYMKEKSQLFKDAGVPHPHNAFRHGFCTFHVAAFKNPGLTATLLCHRNQAMLWARYNGRSTGDLARSYWTITPDTARQMAGPAVAGVPPASDKQAA